MHWATLICLSTLGPLLVGEDQPEGRRHAYRAAEGDLHQAFRRGRDGKLWNQQPEAWIKANESIAIKYSLKAADVELFECSSDNADVRLAYQPGDKDVAVVVRCGDYGSGGKKGSAKVFWRLYEINGRRHHWAMTVHFE